jgi:FAD/FMN-containing dehydrogenase
MFAMAAGVLEAGCAGPILPEPYTPVGAHGCSSNRPVIESPPLRPACCKLWSFDELNHSVALVYRPENEAQLAELLGKIPSGRTVTVRGGAQSLDTQALNDDIVIILDNPEFTRIETISFTEEEGYSLTAGAGANWGTILEYLAPLGLMPPVLCTSGEATVGGTLSANSVSRSSSIYGKEGDQIRSFQMVHTDGTSKLYERPQPGATDADASRKFHAIVGGYGYLGVVTRVTFELIPVRSCPLECLPAVNVLTRSTRYGPNVDWDQLLRDLYVKSLPARRNYLEDPAAAKGATKGRSARQLLAAAPEWPALSITAFFDGWGMSASLLEQRFVEDRPVSPTPNGIYDKDSTVAAFAELVATYWPTAAEVAVAIGFAQGEYVDELFGWTFFLGNSLKNAKKRAHAHGRRLHYGQQSFALPAMPGNGPLDTRPTRRFLELVEARFHGADTRPICIDFLYLPADDFLLSAGRSLPNFLVTVSYAGINQEQLPTTLREILSSLAHDCRTLGGRVHLTKNVVCDRADLHVMHGDAAAEFRALKRELDFKNLLRNEFFDRVLEA